MRPSRLRPRPCADFAAPESPGQARVSPQGGHQCGQALGWTGGHGQAMHPRGVPFTFEVDVDRRPLPGQASTMGHGRRSSQGRGPPWSATGTLGGVPQARASALPEDPGGDFLEAPLPGPGGVFGGPVQNTAPRRPLPKSKQPCCTTVSRRWSVRPVCGRCRRVWRTMLQHLPLARAPQISGGTASGRAWRRQISHIR